MKSNIDLEFSNAEFRIEQFEAEKSNYQFRDRNQNNLMENCIGKSDTKGFPELYDFGKFT